MGTPSTESRKAIYAKVRRALTITGEEPDRREAVRTRLADPRPNLIPERGRLSHHQQVALFCRMAEAVQASVERVPHVDAVPEVVADHLRRNNLPAEIRMGEDLRLAALPWSRVRHLQRRVGRSDGYDLVGLSHAFAGVAESGTLVLVSGPDNPTTLNFLPDTHLVVVNAADIVGDYESIWMRVRRAYGAGV